MTKTLSIFLILRNLKKNSMRNLILLFLLISSFSFAQNINENEIRKTINQLFEGMRNADSISVKSTFSENAVMQTINSKTEVHSEDFRKFAKSVSNFKKGDLDEKIFFESIKIDGNLASVWTPYQFFFQGKFLHCGVNSFQLVKQNEVWKIQYLIDTRRKENCK